jgi:hypothetical protein
MDVVHQLPEACDTARFGHARTADWHIRGETYALALHCLVNQQQREPLAALFGDGFAPSSSDCQFFRAGGFGRNVSSLNAALRRRSRGQVLHPPL